MAVTEDAASVLEQFIHDVANLPAEIAHLYEEANAKQDTINSLNGIIATKDNQLQKWVKSSSALVKHPKEDVLNKDITEAYNKLALLQDEKLALVQKACSLLDRYVKRLDVKIRDLQADGAMPLDNRMPSLLRHSEGNLVAIDSNTSTGANTPNPLQPLSVNTNTSSFNIAQSAINRLTHSATTNRAHSVTAPVHPLHQSQSASTPTANNPLAASVRTREMSASSTLNDAKKRRLNLGTLPMPTGQNGTRHASLGPGTPKASTPSGSRAGSVGPRPGANKKAMMPKKPLMQALQRKKLSKHKNKPPRRLLSGGRASPATTTGDELSADAESGSDDGDYQSQDGKKEEADMDEASDDTKYCYCHDVSHGDMIACDNADCAIQWFHWTCAGITSEPQGEWLCRECRKLPRDKIKKS